MIRWLLILVLAVCACRRPASPPVDARAALEDAWQAGLLTDQEYAAKKNALAPPPSPTVPAPAATQQPAPAPEPKTAPPAAAQPKERASSATPKRPRTPTCEPQDDHETERYFAASPDAVRRAALKSFEELDFNVRSDTARRIEASKRRHLSAVVGAGGERVILTLTPSRQGTLVSAETRKSFVGKLAQRSWSADILARINCRL